MPSYRFHLTQPATEAGKRPFVGYVIDKQNSLSAAWIGPNDGGESSLSRGVPADWIQRNQNQFCRSTVISTLQSIKLTLLTTVEDEFFDHLAGWLSSCTQLHTTRQNEVQVLNCRRPIRQEFHPCPHPNLPPTEIWVYSRNLWHWANALHLALRLA